MISDDDDDDEEEVSEVCLGLVGSRSLVLRCSSVEWIWFMMISFNQGECSVILVICSISTHFGFSSRSRFSDATAVPGACVLNCVVLTRTRIILKNH